jgi:MFS family permease
LGLCPRGLLHTFTQQCGELAFLCCVQVILTLGVVLAQIINIATGKYYPWGWRVSLGLAGIPAIVLTIGGIVLPDTPNSLVERGFEEEGRRVSASDHASQCCMRQYDESPLPLLSSLHCLVTFSSPTAFLCRASCPYRNK